MSGLAERYRYEMRVEVATNLIRDVHTIRFTAAYLAKAIRLPVETMLELAEDLGVILPDTSMHLQAAADTTNPIQGNVEGRADVMG